MHSVVLIDNYYEFRDRYYRMAARQWLETRQFNTDILSAPSLIGSSYWSVVSEFGYLLAYGLSIMKSSVPQKYSKVEGGHYSGYFCQWFVKRT